MDDSINEMLDLFSSFEEDDSWNTVLNLAASIYTSKDPEAVIAAFDRDKDFHDNFNSNGRPALENLIAYLESSNEGLWQDFLSHGPLGLLKGAFYESLIIVHKYCKKYSTKGFNKPVGDNHSIYLPHHSVFESSMKKLDMIYDACKNFLEDGEASIRNIKQVLIMSGVSVKDNGKISDLVNTDWASVRHYLIGRRFGMENGSANEGPISNRGWDTEKLIDAARTICVQIQKLKELKKTPAKEMLKKLELEDKDFKNKLRFYSNALRVYVSTIKILGRGVVCGFSATRTY